MSKLLNGEGIGKNGFDKTGQRTEKEQPPVFLGRTGETLHENKPKLIEGMNPGLSEIQAKIKATLLADPVFTAAEKQGMKTIGIFIPVEFFDNTTYKKIPHKGPQLLLDSLKGSEPFDLVINEESSKGQWKYGDAVFTFCFRGRAENDTLGEFQRLWASVVVRKEDANKLTTILNTNPQEIFDSLLQGMIAKGILRTTDGQRIAIEPGERSILLANKKYTGAWDKSYPAAHPFPKDYVPNQ
jgi:hypothetical protein